MQSQQIRRSHRHRRGEHPAYVTARRYADPGARWLPNVPVSNESLYQMLVEAFVAGARWAESDNDPHNHHH